jgi:hypothetical protein
MRQREEAKLVTEQQPIRQIVLRTNDPILAERSEAAMVRDRELTPQALDRPLSVNLSRLRVITYSAADELIAKWLVLARSEQRDQAVVVALFSPYSVVHETLHATLKARGQAAYSSSAGADPTEHELDLIGEVTRVNEDTLRAVQRHPGGVTASQLAQSLGLAESAASNRLQELVDKGLIVRGGKSGTKGRGRPSKIFLYPFPTKNARMKQRSPQLRPAPSG